MPAYTIAADGKSITCRRCGLTSHNANDVRERYCGRCHLFHDDAGARAMVERWRETTGREVVRFWSDSNLPKSK